jgi:hypothetical protein
MKYISHLCNCKRETNQPAENQSDMKITKSLKTLAKIHTYQRSIAGCLEDAADFKQEGDIEMYNDCLADAADYKQKIIELWPHVSEEDRKKYQGKTVSYNDGNGEVEPYISVN